MTQGQKLRKLKLVACVATRKRETGTGFKVCCPGISGPVFCNIFGSVSNFIKVWRLSRQFLFLSLVDSRYQSVQSSAYAILRWICMWRAELDTKLSLTILLHNQASLHAWVPLKVSVISYFFSRRWGMRGDAAAGRRVSCTGDWAQHFSLTFDPTQHIFRQKWSDAKAPSCRQSRAASLAQVKKSHGGELSGIVHPRGSSWSLPHWRHTPKVWLSSGAVKHLLSWRILKLKWFNPHAGEELKTQSDIITTSCFCRLPWAPEFASSLRLVADESVGPGLFLLLSHNKTLFQRWPESLTKHGSDVHSMPGLRRHVNQSPSTLHSQSELITSQQQFDQIIAQHMICLLGIRMFIYSFFFSFQPHVCK